MHFQPQRSRQDTRCSIIREELMGIELLRQGHGLRFTGVQQPHVLPPGRLGIVRSGHWGDRDPIKSASSPLQLMLRHFEIDGPGNVDLPGVLQEREQLGFVQME
jgi:hypothetical protein